ncbi:MAG: hypothetical protein AAFZ63_02830 [Bacteroidota bacterium]
MCTVGPVSTQYLYVGQDFSYGIAPADVFPYQEAESLAAFKIGDALFMRSWPAFTNLQQHLRLCLPKWVKSFSLSFGYSS